MGSRNRQHSIVRRIVRDKSKGRDYSRPKRLKTLVDLTFGGLLVVEQLKTPPKTRTKYRVKCLGCGLVYPLSASAIRGNKQGCRFCRVNNPELKKVRQRWNGRFSPNAKNPRGDSREDK